MGAHRQSYSCLQIHKKLDQLILRFFIVGYEEFTKWYILLINTKLGDLKLSVTKKEM